jgi:hypothetical protein
VHALGIEAVRGLVKNEDLGLAQERSRQAEALAHSEREPLDTSVANISETDLVEHLVGAGDRKTCGDTQHAKVVARPAARMEARGLKYRSYVSEWIDKVPVPLASDRRTTCRWLDEAEQHPQGGGLARAVRTEESGDAALGNLEAEVVDGDDISETFGQAVYLNGSHDATLRSGRRFHIANETGSRLRLPAGVDPFDLYLVGEEPENPLHYH